MRIGELDSGLDGDWVEGAGGNRIVPTFATVRSGGAAPTGAVQALCAHVPDTGPNSREAFSWLAPGVPTMEPSEKGTVRSSRSSPFFFF